VHGNIVQIYQLGEVDGQFYMSMEFIQGPTVRMVIERHRELGSPLPHVIAAYTASRRGTAAGLISLNEAAGVTYYEVPPDAMLDEAAADPTAPTQPQNKPKPRP